jgi:hypothetical protein
LAAIPAARGWRPSSSRIRLITAAGVAGGLVGFGIDLLASVDETEPAMAIPAGTSALGLIIGAVATKNRPDLDSESGSSMLGAALVETGDRVRVRVPIPQPAMMRVVDGAGRTTRRLGLRLSLIQGSF